ncbi:hypothetical protein, partial [Bacillus mobilis]
PENVKPKPFSGFTQKSGKLEAELPPMAIVLITLPAGPS